MYACLWITHYKKKISFLLWDERSCIILLWSWNRHGNSSGSCSSSSSNSNRSIGPTQLLLPSVMTALILPDSRWVCAIKLVGLLFAYVQDSLKTWKRFQCNFWGWLGLEEIEWIFSILPMLKGFRRLCSYCLTEICQSCIKAIMVTGRFIREWPLLSPAG